MKVSQIIEELVTGRELGKQSKQAPVLSASLGKKIGYDIAKEGDTYKVVGVGVPFPEKIFNEKDFTAWIVKTFPNNAKEVMNNLIKYQQLFQNVGEMPKEPDIIVTKKVVADKGLVTAGVVNPVAGNK